MKEDLFRGGNLFRVGRGWVDGWERWDEGKCRNTSWQWHLWRRLLTGGSGGAAL